MNKNYSPVCTNWMWTVLSAKTRYVDFFFFYHALSIKTVEQNQTYLFKLNLFYIFSVLFSCNKHKIFAKAVTGDCLSLVHLNHLLG